MEKNKFSTEPLTDCEWRWIVHYCHPCQLDEIMMKPYSEQVQIIRGLIHRAKASYRAAQIAPPHWAVSRD